MSQSGSLPIDTRLIFCNKCNRETNHICKLHEYSSYPLESDEDLQDLAADDPDLSIDDYPRSFEINGYLLWACAGCDTWTVENYSTMIPEGEDPLIFDRGNFIFSFIPERTKFHAQTKQFHQLSPALEGIYREILHSYNYGLPVLCAVGIRMLLEGICADHEIQGKTVAQKIEGLTAILPTNIVNHLHDLRFMGNEAAHELNPPDQEQLHLAISLIEDILNFLYELDYRASSFTKWREIKRASNKLDKDAPTKSDEGSGQQGESSLLSDSDDD
jgi:hypothetical protein